MAAKTATFDTAQLCTVEQLAHQNHISAAVHHGAMTMVGWHTGKMVSPDEYEAAIRNFLKTETGKGG